MTDKIRVAVVDASPDVREALSAGLGADPAIEVAASWDKLDSILTLMKRQSEDGKVDAVVIDLGLKNAPDIVSQILSLRPPVGVILTGDSSQEVMQRAMPAMRKGAADFIIKPSSSSGDKQFDAFLREVGARLNVLKNVKGIATVVEPEKKQAQVEAAVPLKNLSFQPKPVGFLPKVLAIASSTGGPKAVLQVFEELKGKSISIPIFITQHMPKEFTHHFAEQIHATSGIPCTEGKEGEEVVPGHVYVAPGDYHMGVKKNAVGKMVIQLNQDPPENFCRPAADPMMRSLIDAYGGPAILMVVLTGMGQDGMKGAEQLVKEGGLVLAQDHASSVVWGMPGAVATAGLAHKLYPLSEISAAIMEHSSGRIA